MIDADQVDVITNSWGIYGEPTAPGQVKADEQAFQQAAAEGITVLFSSGDDRRRRIDLRGVAQGSWPATSPFVTAVGGTSLAPAGLHRCQGRMGLGHLHQPCFQEQHRSRRPAPLVTGGAWSPWPPEFQYGSGGGISLLFPQPADQAGVVPDAIATTHNHR